VKNALKYIWFIGFVVICFTQISAQSLDAPQFKAGIEKQTVLIGEQTKVNLVFKYRRDQGEIELEWPQIKDTITAKIEVIEAGQQHEQIEQKEDPYGMIHYQTLVITSFDSGYYAIPPFKAVFNGDTILSNPLLFEVNTVEIDTSRGIADIKGIFDEPYSTQDAINDSISWIKENWVWVVLGLIILVGVISSILYLRNRNKSLNEEEKPKLSPHDHAYQRLANLNNQKLWQQGKVKEFYIELSDTIRIYLEERYKFNALELTTDEILSHLKFIDISTSSKAMLTEILKKADLVKFAKQKPEGNENQLSMANTYKFVDQTKIIEELTSVIEDNQTEES